MGLTAITHPTSPYNRDYIEGMCNVGFTPEFQVSSRGAETDREAAKRYADALKEKLDREPRDLSWLDDEEKETDHD